MPATESRSSRPDRDSPYCTRLNGTAAYRTRRTRPRAPAHPRHLRAGPRDGHDAMRERGLQWRARKMAEALVRLVRRGLGECCADFLGFVEVAVLADGSRCESRDGDPGRREANDGRVEDKLACAGRAEEAADIAADFRGR